MKKIYSNYFLIALTFLVLNIFPSEGRAQCPIGNNFQNFGSYDLTPTVQGPTGTQTGWSTWGGDYHVISVTSGETYEISTCNSGPYVPGLGYGGTWPAGTPYVGQSGYNVNWDPQMTLVGPTINDIITNNDDFCGVFPKITYTATYTGDLYIVMDSATVCDQFEVDTIVVDVTWLVSCIATSSTISPTACDSLVSQSGNQVWTTTGSYFDTIPNNAGCDSVITVNLIVNNRVVHTADPVTECDSAQINSNWYYTTQSVRDSFPGQASNGCDSIAVTALTINNRVVYNADPVTECDSAQINTNWYYTTQSVRDSFPGQASNGCDSIAVTALTINNRVVYSADPVSECDSALIVSTWYYTSQTVRDSFPGQASNGCDSIAVTVLTISNRVVYTADPVTECDSAQLNSNWYFTSQIVRDSFPNSATNGCDSIAVTDLTINNRVVYNADPITECDSAEINGNWYYTSQIVRDSLPGSAANGCDSIVVTNLTIHSLCCDPGTTTCQIPDPSDLSGYESDLSTGTKIYDNFSGIIGGITDIEWWGSTGNGTINCSENPKNFEITFYYDNTGTVGGVKATYNVEVTGTETGSSFGTASTPILKYSYSLSTPVSGLQSGWVSIQGNPTGTCNFTWITSNSGDGLAYVEGGGKAPVTDDFAFSITADPSIPIANWPIYLGILAMGAFVVVRFRKRLA
ncbi:MAG: hypothetical protein HQ521_09970 [Bacteroidetes bacterium]|nr:hypothetical protein [Bacteroidota bacterium]